MGDVMNECEHCKDMEGTRKQVSDIHKMLTGNGDPVAGLVFKVAIVEQHVKFMNTFGGWILAGAVGVPFAVLTGFILFKLQQ
jgi:hypothetical protein